MRRTDRLFELLQLFRGGRFWRGKDLAEELGVSLRTVYRDIDTLAASGFPIEGERGVGYALREPIFLPPLTLSAIELEALQLGVAMVARSGDVMLAKAARALLTKVDSVVPTDRRGRDFAKGIALHTPCPDGPHEHLPTLRDAIRNRRKLSLVYRRLDGMMSERHIRPLQLEFWGHVWTLTAWCETRNDFRVFRVDRIEIAKAKEAFGNEPGKTYADFLDDQSPGIDPT